MTWSKDDWMCQVCGQRTYEPGPWCQVYTSSGVRECPPYVAERIRRADAVGDGPMVNALCAYARKLWGEGLYW